MIILKAMALVTAFFATLATGFQVIRIITTIRKAKVARESIWPLAIAIFCWYIFFKL